MTKVKVKFNSNIATASDGKTASQVNTSTLYFTVGQTANDTLNQKLFVGGRDYTGVKSVTAGSSAGKINVDGTEVIIPGWDNFIPNSQKGANNGVATLDNSGKVPATQLPSFVDDVIVLEGCYEYNYRLYRPLINGKLKSNPVVADFNASTEISPTAVTNKIFLALDYSISNNLGLYKYDSTAPGLGWVRMTGEGGKIYVEISTGKTYRFADNTYLPIEISASPGTTDEVLEGNTNKYFTEARAQAAVATQLAGKLNKPASFTPSHLAMLVPGIAGSSDGTTVADCGYTANDLLGTTKNGHYDPDSESTSDESLSIESDSTPLSLGSYNVISSIIMDVHNHIKHVYGRTLSNATKQTNGLMSAEDKALIESLYWES